MIYLTYNFPFGSLCMLTWRDKIKRREFLTNYIILTLHHCLFVAVKTHTVLPIVPPQGCEAILIEILQPKQSAGGQHFTCCFVISKETYNRSRYITETLTLIFLGRVSFVFKTHYYMFYRQFSSQLCYERKFSLINSTA